MKRPSIAIITRMAFKDLLTPNQMERFREYLTCIHSQTYKDFSVYILADKVRNFQGNPDNLLFINLAAKGVEQIKIEDPERFKYDIEVRLDYDDLISPQFVENLVDHFNTWQIDNYIISHQPIIHDVNTDQNYTHPSQYSEECASMCMALVQKGKKTRGVYDRPHDLMVHDTGWPCIVEGEGYYYLQVHGQNTLTQLPGEEYLKTEK